MNFTNILRILENLLNEHERLYTLSLKKVDVIKQNDIEALNQIMKDEQKHVASITILENERQQELQKIFPEKSNPTIRDCIEHAGPVDKLRLENLYQKLLTVIEKLKEQNELNQQLIYNSLQFVNFSLNLFRPKSESVTYGPPAKKQHPKDGASVFNSQA